MIRSTKLLLALSLVLLFSGCDNLPFFKKEAKHNSVNKPPVGIDVVAKVGSMYITADDLNREVEAYNALVAAQGGSQKKITTRDEKLEYLRGELVRQYMFYQAALDKGLDRSKDVVAALEYDKIMMLVKELLRTELAKIEVSV